MENKSFNSGGIVSGSQMMILECNESVIPSEHTIWLQEQNRQLRELRMLNNLYLVMNRLIKIKKDYEKGKL